MKKLITICLMSALLLTLAACGNQQAQTKKYYRLNAAQEIAATTKKDVLLVVKRPTALSILGGRPMVATQADGSLVQLSHNYWLESPKVLLQDRLKNWANNHWHKVTTKTPYADSYHSLETRILAFEKQQNQAVLSLEFFVYDQDNTLLHNKRYNQTQTIDAESGFKGFVKAMNQALDAAFSQLAQDLL